MSQILVQMRNISKHFGVVKALDKVNMDIYSHEIHALLGENGAGKSTLMKLLSGLHRPTSGSIAINVGISARLGESDYFVIEADEYDTAFFDKRSKFVHYNPKTLIINNIGFDHADIFDEK